MISKILTCIEGKNSVTYLLAKQWIPRSRWMVGSSLQSRTRHSQTDIQLEKQNSEFLIIFQFAIKHEGYVLDENKHASTTEIGRNYLVRQLQYHLMQYPCFYFALLLRDTDSQWGPSLQEDIFVSFSVLNESGKIDVPRGLTRYNQRRRSDTLNASRKQQRAVRWSNGVSYKA